MTFIICSTWKRSKRSKPRFSLKSTPQGLLLLCLHAALASKYFLCPCFLSNSLPFSINVVKVVLKVEGVMLSTVDKLGFNCMHYAVQFGHLEVLKFLQGKNLAYCKSKDGTTCLHIAARKGYSHIVDFLLSKRAPDYLKQKKKVLKKQHSKVQIQEINDIDNTVNRLQKWEKTIDVDEQKL